MKNLAHNTLSKLKKISDQAEVFILTSKSLKIDIKNQKTESLDNLSTTGMGIRVIKAAKLGFAYTSEFSLENISQTIQQAVYNSAHSMADKNHTLPSARKSELNFSIFDKTLDKIDLAKKIELARQTENWACQADPRVKMTEKVTYQEAVYQIVLQNSCGVEVEYSGSDCGIMASVIARQNGETESGSSLAFALNFADLNSAQTGREAGQKAVELLGAKTIPSQKLTLVLEPLVATEFLEVISHLISADAVQKGKSLLAGKLGKVVASSKLSITDNGKLINGIASRPYDCEGSPTQKTEILKAGILQSYIHNMYTAAKGKTKSTGNAARTSFKTPPGLGSSNFYIENGNTPSPDIIHSVDKGLFVTRVMGMHTVNPISGDFSVGAAGRLIEKGKKTYPVKGITLAGNLIEILKSIEAVGNDLKFIGSSGSPTLLVSNVAVGGE